MNHVFDDNWMYIDKESEMDKENECGRKSGYNVGHFRS
jgi:hypothetical protein